MILHLKINRQINKSLLIILPIFITSTVNPNNDGLGTIEEFASEKFEKSLITNNDPEDKITHTRTHLMTQEEEHSSEVVGKYVSDLIKESVENAIITINEKEQIKKT